MTQKQHSFFYKLQAELRANNGIVPDNWKPWIDLLLILLPLIKPFVNDDIDLIIDEIIAAIKALESV